jgi:hypothetical protein
VKRYQEFLNSKRVLARAMGFECGPLNPMLMPFQADIVRWAVLRGKAAVFAHTGLGKGPIQMEWGAQVCNHVGKPVLILAPLAVAEQFEIEAAKFSYGMTLCEDQGDVRPGLNVTNYDRIDKFDLDSFGGVAMDESSCIKDFNSQTTRTLIQRLARMPYKLCSTATPSPNDHTELGTHAELLDVMTRASMLAMFFEHDGGETSKWILKGHANKAFWEFVASWAVCLVKPSDLGYSDEGYDIPALHMHEHIVPVDQSVNTDGMLFRSPDLSATGLHKEMRLTAASRAAKVAELVSATPDKPWIVWCNTDYEAKELRAVLPSLVEVRGSDSRKLKKQRLIGFARGEFLHMLSKPEIAGFGMNYQHCWNMAFVGLSYSFEQFFQAVRRCWRFGQLREVNAHLVIAETEGPVLAAIREKETQYEELQAEMNAAMRREQLKARHIETNYDHVEEIRIPEWLKAA